MKYRLCLLLTAFIWGSTFIFQRIAADTVGAFAFGGIRFFLGFLSILPVVYWQYRVQQRRAREKKALRPKAKLPLWVCSLCLGSFLFLGAALQQVGLSYTTASKSGFITAMYIVLVPIIGLYFYQPLRLPHVIGAILSVTGIYLLSFHSTVTALNYGDLLTIISVFFWSMQIVSIDRFVQWHNGVFLAAGQLIVCAVLNVIASYVVNEPLTLPLLKAALIPILYAGVLSSGVAFTLQIIGQSKVPPTEGSMLMSLEMIFSGVLGVLCLHESMSSGEWFGAVLMTLGVFIAQLKGLILWVRPQV